MEVSENGDIVSEVLEDDDVESEVSEDGWNGIREAVRATLAGSGD